MLPPPTNPIEWDARIDTAWVYHGYAPRMAEYTKSTHFSVGWMIGGSVLMFLTNIFAGFLLAGLAVQSLWAFAGAALVAFAIGGFVIGWQSEGRTILEAGLAAVIANGVALAIKGLTTMDPVALAVGIGVPFVAALFGAWIGELVQGNVIVTQDD
jgi:hypothetical protein